MTAKCSPSVTVIVPVYNVARFLSECLDSLLLQTFRDFEIVAVNDGSTDDSGDLLARYAAEYPGVVRVFSKPNGGLGDARNVGIERARGEYLSFVDADDTVEPTFLAELFARAAATDADLVLCGILNVFDDGTPAAYLPEPDMSVFGSSLSEEPRLLYRVDASACNKLYARELFTRTGIRFPVGLAFEDLPTVYRWLAFANRVEKVDEPLYLYRRDRSGSITSESARYLELVTAFTMLDDFYAEQDLRGLYRSSLLRLNLTHLIAGRYPDLFPAVSRGVRRTFVSAAFELLDVHFPGWRADPVCRDLWPNPILRLISTRREALLAFCMLPRRALTAAAARLGAFDPLR